MQYDCGLIFCTCDPLHYGHIRFFKAAKLFCKTLYAVTESDQIIRDEKGREPFTSTEGRVSDLEGIRYLEEVFVRDEARDRLFYVEQVKPDVILVGEDWQGRDWAGTKLGVPVIYLPRTEEISSTYLRAVMAPMDKVWVWPGNI